MLLDATRVKAHPAASTGRRRRGEKRHDADIRRCFGRSRGGWRTNKLHAAVNERGQLLRLIITPVSGAKPRSPRRCWTVCMFGTSWPTPAYDSDAICRLIRKMTAGACIKPNPTRRRKKRYDHQRYKHSNVIERFFERIKQCRRIATRYEKKAADFASFVWLAAGITTPNECP